MLQTPIVCGPFATNSIIIRLNTTSTKRAFNLIRNQKLEGKEHQTESIVKETVVVEERKDHKISHFHDDIVGLRSSFAISKDSWGSFDVKLRSPQSISLLFKAADQLRDQTTFSHCDFNRISNAMDYDPISNRGHCKSLYQ